MSVPPMPEPLLEIPQRDGPEVGVRESGQMPFGDLIKDVSRLMKGEVVLVRRSAEGAGDSGDEDEHEDGSDE